MGMPLSNGTWNLVAKHDAMNTRVLSLFIRLPRLVLN